MIYLKSLLSSWNDEKNIQIQINRPLCCLCSGEALGPRGRTHCTGFIHAALVSEVNRAFEERGVTPILETLGPRLTSHCTKKLQRLPQLLTVVVIATHGLHTTFPQVKGELV